MPSSSSRLHFPARARLWIVAACGLGLLSLVLPADGAAAPISGQDVPSGAAFTGRLISPQSPAQASNPSLAIDPEASQRSAATELELRAAMSSAPPMEFQPYDWTGRLDAGPEFLPADPRASNETLRQTLRALATMHRADLSVVDQSQFDTDRYGSGRSRAAWSRDDGDEEAASAGMAGVVLDSDVAADAVRALVQIKSTDALSTTFSVLGLGEFVLEATPGGHVVTLTELSSGLSTTLPVGGSGVTGASGPNPNGRGAEEAGDGSRPNINYVRIAFKLIWEFLESPLGFLLTMLLSIMLLLWAMVRTFAVFGRMTSRTHLR